MTNLSEAVERLRSSIALAGLQNMSRAFCDLTDLAALIDFYDAMQWRPIEEAPKDGTSIIAICADAYSPTPGITWWQDAWMKMMRPDKFVVSWEPIRWQPTHWMPLSAIPLPEEKK